MIQTSVNQIVAEDLFVRAQACIERGDLAQAEQLLLSLINESTEETSSGRIVQARRALPDLRRAIVSMCRGRRGRHEGDLVDAGMCYRRALRLLKQTNDEMSRARLQNNLGVMLLYQGNFYEAANSSRRALEHLAGHQ